MKENLILCGFMGCGKTTVGRRLAALSGRELVDMDAYIEKEQGKTVREIFAALGESAFRQMETDAARALSQKNGLVIASGGGTVLNPENVRLLRQSGKILLAAEMVRRARDILVHLEHDKKRRGAGIHAPK